MSEQTLQAVVLHFVDYRESDRIVTVFTRELGKISGRARGARKSNNRFPGRLDLFTRYILVMATGRGAPSFERGDLVDAHFGLRQDLYRLTWASVLVEMTDHMFGEGEAHPAAFDVLSLALKELASPQPIRVETLFRAELGLLREAGLLPQLGACINCGKEVGSGPVFRFSVTRGGPVCRECNPQDEGLAVNPGTLKLLEMCERLPDERISQLIFSEEARMQGKRLLHNFLKYHVREGIKSLTFLESLE